MQLGLSIGWHLSYFANASWDHLPDKLPARPPRIFLSSASEGPNQENNSNIFTIVFYRTHAKNPMTLQLMLSFSSWAIITKDVFNYYCFSSIHLGFHCQWLLKTSWKDSALIKQIAYHLKDFVYLFSFPSNAFTFKLCLYSVVLIIKSLRTLMWPFNILLCFGEVAGSLNQQNQIP